MWVEFSKYVEDLSIPHLTGSRIVTDPFGVMRVEQIQWVYLGDGKYCEAEQWSATDGGEE